MIKLSLADGLVENNIFLSRDFTLVNREFVFKSEIFDKVEDPSFKIGALTMQPRT